MEKQRLLYQQSRLHNRGAAEMVLQMISACKGAVWALPPIPGIPLPADPACPLCMPPAYRHTPAPADVLACLSFESPLHIETDCVSFIPFLPVPTVGFSVGGNLRLNRSFILLIFFFFLSLSLRPPGETGAMVSSTLKLGISILNGGNAEVQQVTESWEEGLRAWGRGGWVFLSGFRAPLIPISCHFHCRKCWIT